MTTATDTHPDTRSLAVLLVHLARNERETFKRVMLTPVGVRAAAAAYPVLADATVAELDALLSTKETT